MVTDHPIEARGLRFVGPTVALRRRDYLRCLPTSFVMSNMLTLDLPPRTAFSGGPALIIRLFFESCNGGRHLRVSVPRLAYRSASAGSRRPARSSRLAHPVPGALRPEPWGRGLGHAGRSGDGSRRSRPTAVVGPIRGSPSRSARPVTRRAGRAPSGRSAPMGDRSGGQPPPVFGPSFLAVTRSARHGCRALPPAR
jgi:hypothetical protein